MIASLPHALSGPAWAGRTVGLLGGSFNPPHAGHMHDSLLALRTLGLDRVWWLVSPQNPLKPRHGMAPFDQRLAAARAFAHHPRIVVSDIEARLGTIYTADTLDRLAQLYPKTRFVWLMGADNMIQIRHWDRWQDIFAAVPVAVFDRPPYSTLVESALAAKRFAGSRAKGRNQTGLVYAKPPRWAFFHTPLKDLSSTILREQGFWPQ